MLKEEAYFVVQQWCGCADVPYRALSRIGRHESIIKTRYSTRGESCKNVSLVILHAIHAVAPYLSQNRGEQAIQSRGKRKGGSHLAAAKLGNAPPPWIASQTPGKKCLTIAGPMNAVHEVTLTGIHSSSTSTVVFSMSHPAVDM